MKTHRMHISIMGEKEKGKFLTQRRKDVREKLNVKYGILYWDRNFQGSL